MVKSPTAKTEETAVAKTGGSGVALIPEFMQGKAGIGLETLNSGDVETPRIKLLQATSPEVEENEDLKPGYFYHTGINQPIGRSFEAVILFFEKRALLWRPRHDGGGILARSVDLKTWNVQGIEWSIKPIKDNPKTVTWKIPESGSVPGSGLLEWGSSIPGDQNSKPAANLMYNYVLAFPDDLDMPPGVLTLQNSGQKQAKKLNQKLQLARAPIYGIRIQVEAFQETNADGQKYWNSKFSSLGLVQDEELFSFFEASHTALKEMGLKMADVEEGDPAERGEAAGSAAGTVEAGAKF